MCQGVFLVLSHLHEDTTMFGGRGFEKAHFRIRQWLQGNKGSPRQSLHLPSKRSRLFFFSSSIFQSASVRASDWGLGIFDYANGGDWLSGDDQCNKGDSPMMVWKKTAPFS